MKRNLLANAPRLSKRVAVLFAVIFAAIGSYFLYQSFAADGTILFQDSFETAAPGPSYGSFGEWTVPSPQPNDGQVSAVTSAHGTMPRQGSRMLQLEVRPTDCAPWSCGTLQASAIQRDVAGVGNNTDVYMGFSLYIVPGFVFRTGQNANNTLAEYHGNWIGGQAPIHFGVTDATGAPGDWFLDLHRGMEWNPTFFDRFGAAEQGKWFNVVLRTKWSSGNDGAVQLWMKPSGAGPMTSADLKVNRQNIATWNTFGGPGIYPLLMIYKGKHASYATVLFDVFKLGTTLAVVDPAGGTTTPPPPAPTIVFTSSSITTGQTLSGTVNWTVDTTGPVAKVEYWANGTKLAEDTTPPSPFTFYLNTTQLPNGANALGLAIVGTDGTRITPQIGQVTVSNTAASPTPTWTSSIADGASVPAGTTWSATVSPIPASVEFWHTPSGTSQHTLLKTDTSAPYDVVLNLPTGSHILGVCATHSGVRTCFNDRKTVTITSSGPPTHIAAADLNNDTKVNILDLSILLKHYGTTAPEADISGDGQVNITDLSTLLNRYE